MSLQMMQNVNKINVCINTWKRSLKLASLYRIVSAKEEYELSRGRLITVAYKVMMHIDFETDLEKKHNEIIKNQNKMKTSKIKSIQADGTRCYR